MVGIVNAGLNIAATGFKTNATYVSLHTADPGTGGTNESTATRQSASWSGPTNGVLTLASTPFTGGASSGACTHVGYWSAVSSGTFYGSRALTGDQTFNAAGAYTVTSVTETFASA